MYHLQLARPVLPQPGDPVKDYEGKTIGTVAGTAKADDAAVEVLAVLADKSAGCTEIQVGNGPLSAITHLPLPYDIPASP